MSGRYGRLGETGRIDDAPVVRVGSSGRAASYGSASDFTLSAVNWGDGSTSTAGLTVTGSGGNCAITGSHQYTASGTYNFSITVTDAGGQTATLPGTATVASYCDALSSGVVTIPLPPILHLLPELLKAATG